MKKCRGPRPPGRLSAEAKGLWKRFNELYELDDVALTVLGSALECFDTMRAAQKLIAAEGLVLVDRFGQKKAHPAVLIERDAKANLLRHVKSLNMDLEPLHDKPGRPPGR